MPSSYVPTSALDRLPAIQTANQNLVRAFAAHPAFTAHFMQRSGKVFFMWDFANRTGQMLEASLSGNLPAGATQAQKDELKEDSVGRCMMLWSMIKDTSGKTAIMFGEVPGQGLELGDEIQRAADAVRDTIDGAPGASS